MRGDPAQRWRMMMGRFDADGDGKLSRDEAPPFMRERFGLMDRNGDGFVTEDEMREMRGRGGPPRRL